MTAHAAYCDLTSNPTYITCTKDLVDQDEATENDAVTNDIGSVDCGACLDALHLQPANKGTANFPTDPIRDKRIPTVTCRLLKGRH